MKRWPLHKAYFWETAPFFRVLLPLAAGIFCYERQWLQDVPGSLLLLVTCIMFLFFLVVVYVKKNNNLRSIVTFLLLNLTVFFSGYSSAYFSDIQHNQAWFGHNMNEGTVYRARITDALVEKNHSWKVPVNVLNAINDGKNTHVTGRAFLYVYKDGPPVQFHKGDTILLPGKWQPITNAGNPFEFDYAGYCRQNNIYYQQFCAAKDVRLYAPGDPAAASFISRSHDWCMLQLGNYITDQKTKGLLQAMLLGDDINLDQDLRRSYSETGIVHIIAISGSHVAIFFLLISLLLWWIRDKKHLLIKYAIAFPLVWFYVLLAGAPPSAVRAAVMFSLLAFAIVLQKNTNSLNQLFSTAFLLLCMQPGWLFSAGFQLSFVAVLSLMLFYRPVYRWVSPVHKITRFFWGGVAAGISAEILIAPLVIYYFHTFPLLFIVTNIAAYLFMGLVLILGVLIIALSWLPVVTKCIGILTVWIVTVFDRVVVAMQNCSPVSFHFLMLTGVELITIYLMVIAIALFLLKKQKRALFIGVGVACVLLLFFCNDEWVRLQQQRLVVYNTGNADHIELIKGNTYAVIHTDTAAGKNIEYATTPAHIGWQAWKKDSISANEIFDIGGKTILLLNHDIKTGNRFPVDYLVVNYVRDPNLAQLQQVFSPREVIIGNNYTKKQQDKWVKEGVAAGITVHAVANDGAFVLK